MKTNIFFIIPSLHGGGSERVITHILRNINKEEFNITLVLVKKEGILLDAVPEYVSIINLNSSKTRNIPLKLIRLIWQYKPDIVFSTLGHLNLVIASCRFLMPAKTKFIARESSTVSMHNKNEVFPKLFDFLFKTVYKSFDKIVCQSEYMQKDLISSFKIPKTKTCIINNPVDFNSISQQTSHLSSPFLNSKINFVAIGRISKEKGFNRLVDAFCLVLNKQVHLTIVGDGIERIELEQYIYKQGQEGRISLIGFNNNPYSYMYHAKALLMTSFYEGFPNVVIEANACGTPVIALNSPGGISEIIQNEKNGWLILNDDLKALASTIDRVAMHNSINRNDIINMTREKYDMSFIIEKYERLFSQTK